jgi:endo-1,4-beta-xylanase
MKSEALVMVAVACSLLAIAIPVVGSLGSAAAGRGRYFGAAIAGYYLSTDTTYANTFDAEFTSAVCENEMKWDATEGTQNQFTFSGADTIVNHALAHNMQVRGHTLVWHAQLPQWVSSITSSSQLLAAMNNHITHVAQHYAGNIYAWDVVNEAFDDNGNGMRNAQESVWTRVLGNNYNFIETAFRTARAADPTAKLCYNDYGTEGMWPKTNNIYNMVADFKARGVPIDCVGFQTHLGSVPSDFQANLQRFADLGVDVQITELDVGGSGQTQANTYAAVVNACLGVSRCAGITVWGITDKYSWRSADTPLLFDSNFGMKAAYYAVVNAFGTPSTCTAPANPANGHFTCTSTTCTLICDDGYGATGTGYATCNNNVWSTLPACGIR